MYYYQGSSCLLDEFDVMQNEVCEFAVECTVEKKKSNDKIDERTEI
jgi:hypothetical protein